jgi:ketosteroid isomerase-like protein
VLLFRVQAGQITDVAEYLDSALVETALFAGAS